MKLRGIAIAACIALGTANAQDATPTAQTPVNFTVVDSRPETDKKTKFLSLMISSCDYSVRRLGDERTDPAKLDVLRADLLARLGSGLEGKTLTVTSWSVYFNNSVRVRGMVYGGSGLLEKSITDFIKGMGSNCPREKASGGWYEAADMTTPYSPLISEFSGTLDGKPVQIRTVYSPPAEIPGQFKKKPADIEALNAVIHQTAEKLALTITETSSP